MTLNHEVFDVIITSDYYFVAVCHLVAVLCVYSCELCVVVACYLDV